MKKLIVLAALLLIIAAFALGFSDSDPAATPAPSKKVNLLFTQPNASAPAQLR
jgi:hypothetical protein